MTDTQTRICPINQTDITTGNEANANRQLIPHQLNIASQLVILVNTPPWKSVPLFTWIDCKNRRVIIKANHMTTILNVFIFFSFSISYGFCHRLQRQTPILNLPPIIHPIDLEVKASKKALSLRLF